MARYLITGGAGFIGSNIAEKLISQGDSVKILDNFSSGYEHNLEFAKGLPKDRFEVIRGDISSVNDCERSCEGVDYVLHQAGLKSVPKSLKDPLSYNHVNIDGILYLLQAASKHKVKRFVFASSSSVYGNTTQFPQREDQLSLLISPYALSKLAGEYYCRIFSEFFNIETVALRYFNVFGPKQALDDEYSAVIPKFINCIMNNEPPPIFGTGKQSRDFTYIDNVVSANIIAATTPGLKHEVFNAAVGKEYSVLDIVAAINKILGKNVAPQFLPVRAGDIFRSNSDITKIQTMTPYRPLVSFEDGMEKTVAHYMKQFKK
ncbi:MAG: SDR family oxidoreductase [Candidatus Omnitrophica bacterium]|nr:SDR family oxidoreductase [Candidatus Omnitrophota bacterium]